MRVSSWPNSDNAFSFTPELHLKKNVDSKKKHKQQQENKMLCISMDILEAVWAADCYN